MRQLSLLLLIILIAGCGRSPFEPAPPIVDYGTFEQTMAQLKTPAHAEVWLNENVTVDKTVVTYLKYDGTDLCEEQARLVYQTRRGSCGHYSAIYVYAARTHGYECGGLVRPKFYVEGKGWFPGHLMGWIKDDDGRIHVIDDDGYIVRETNQGDEPSYADLDELLKAYPTSFLLNNKFQVIELL